MSYLDYEEAMRLAPKCEYYTTTGGVSEETIKKAEEIMGINFSKQCKVFYKDYGYLSFCGNEIFGIDPDDDSGVLEGNSVAYALNDRKENNLPLEWLPIYDCQDGCMVYLDYSVLNEDDEPRVIIAYYNGEGYEIEDIIAEDFGEFVMQLIEDELSEE